MHLRMSSRRTIAVAPGVSAVAAVIFAASCATAPTAPPSTVVAPAATADAATPSAAEDVRELAQLIQEREAEANRTNGQAHRVSSEGSVEFWSSGGLRHHVTDHDAMPDFEFRNLVPKDIEITSIVPGRAAIATYYSEGSMKQVGAPTIERYLTRVLVVYVKEDGEWRVRAAHWSPIVGGTGALRNAVDEGA